MRGRAGTAVREMVRALPSLHGPGNCQAADSRRSRIADGGKSFHPGAT